MVPLHELWKRLSVAGAALVGLPLAYALAEAQRFEVTEHTVPLARLPERWRGTRILQLTDFHTSPWVTGGYLRRVVATCRHLAPDLVVLTGDYIENDVRRLSVLTAALADLRPPGGLFGSLGNHDRRYGVQAVVSALTSIGCRMLINEALDLGDGFWLAGLDDTWVGRPDLSGLKRAVPTDAACVLLSHNPRAVQGVGERDWLVLSGHTHGGQVRVPGFRAPMPSDVADTPFVSGWHPNGRARVYVNRGIGSGFPPVRFRCRPEIAVFTLETA